MVNFPAIGSVCILWEFTLSSFYNPTFPPHPPYFSHPDYSISKSILPLLPLRASHNSQTFPPATVPGCPSHLCRDPRHVGNGHLDRRGHRTFGKTMEKREAAKQWWPATRVCHSCTRSTLQGVGRGIVVTTGIKPSSGEIKPTPPHICLIL